MAKLKFYYRILSLISFSTLLAVTLFIIWLNSDNASSYREGFKSFLLDELISINPPLPNKNIAVIYVLGGSQRSLEYKYKIAADFFHKGRCKSIWILSRPGLTEYSPSFGRNMTNDEWSLVKFKAFGVPKKYIEPTKIKEGFFGTFAEAKGVSSLVKEKRYKSILLISEPSHTQRVKICFDTFLKNQNCSLFIQGSDEEVFLRHLLIEFFKLKVYQYFLIG